MQTDLDSKKYRFENREDAALELMDVLPFKQMQDEKWRLVAISSGAVPIVEMIAQKSSLKYDVLFTEPVCAPNNKECIVAMVSETEEIVTHEALIDSFDISLNYIYGEARRKYEEKILKYVYKYRKGALIRSLKGENVLLVDEGCENGLTAMTAIKTAINMEARRVAYAVPIVPQDVASDMEKVADELFFVCNIADFLYSSFYYEDGLEELDSEEILSIIEKSKNYLLT